MNKYEKKLDNALKDYETHVVKPKHSIAWIYVKLRKWYWKDRLSEYWTDNFIERVVILTEDSVYD